jgi:NAD(P)H-flavin reductase
MSKAFGKSIRYGFRAADHVFASIPSLGWKYTFQAHPLVIASPVPAPSADVAQLDFIVRARERFSLDLLNKARKHDRLKVRLDGPYGSSLARGVLADAEIAILVAGGSGIAVAWPLLHYLVELNRSSEAPGAPSFALRTRKVVLVWVVRKRLHVSWIGQAALDEIEHSNVDVIVPEATEDHGRPALESIVGDLVKRYGRGKRTGVVASGPTSLTRDVRNICAGLVWQGRDVHLGIEKFGW